MAALSIKIRAKNDSKKKFEIPTLFLFILQMRMKTNILTLGIINSNTMGMSWLF